MEQNLGTFGTATESYSKGVASAQVQGNLPANAFGLSLQVSVTGSINAETLISYLAGKIGGAVPAEVASFINLALSAT